MLTNIKARTRDAAIAMVDAQKNTIRAGEEDLRRLPEWSELTQEEQANVLSQLEALIINVSDDLQGLKKLISQEFVSHCRLRDLKERIIKQGQQRLLRRIEEEKEKAKQGGKSKITRSVRLPSSVTSADQLDVLIRQLQDLKNELTLYNEIKITLNIGD